MGKWAKKADVNCPQTSLNMMRRKLNHNCLKLVFFSLLDPNYHDDGSMPTVYLTTRQRSNKRDDSLKQADSSKRTLVPNFDGYRHFAWCSPEVPLSPSGCTDIFFGRCSTFFRPFRPYFAVLGPIWRFLPLCATFGLFWGSLLADIDDWVLSRSMKRPGAHSLKDGWGAEGSEKIAQERPTLLSSNLALRQLN